MKISQLRHVIHQYCVFTGREYPKSVRLNPEDFSELLSECMTQDAIMETGKLLLVGMEPIPDWKIPQGCVEFPAHLYKV